MTDLEFDLLGTGYARGYGSALTAHAGHPVKVLVSRHCGHLYSALATDTTHAGMPLPDIAAPSWKQIVLPRLAEHFALIGELADEAAGTALIRARTLFAECIALHHEMLLPARQAITDLLTTSSMLHGDTSSSRSRQTILAAITAIGTPTFLAAARLADNDLPQALSDSRVISLIVDTASDGDGYGLAQPGWLDDAAYARRARRLLRRFGVTRPSLLALQADATARRSAAIADLTSHCAAARRPELASQVAAAQAGAALAEMHGPLMHVRYLHELRRLVLIHGSQLASAGLLDQPNDILHARLTELDQHAIRPHLLRRRRTAYARYLREPLPPSFRLSRAPFADLLPPSIAARLAVLGHGTGQQSGERSWTGIAAARGSGSGPLRVVRTQADLDKVQPGDVALVPDASPAWGWLALAGIPLVIECGGLLGHAPALARESGTSCVIAGPGLALLLTEGNMVKVSGDTAEVTW